MTGDLVPPQPDATPRVVLLPPVSHAHEPGFAEILAAEVRKAPWLGLSLVLHGVIFGLLALLFGGNQGGPGRDLVVRAGVPETLGADILTDSSPELEHKAEEADPTRMEQADPGDVLLPNPPVEPDPSALPDSHDLGLAPAWSEQSLLTRVGGKRGAQGGGGDDVLELSKGLLAGDGFKSTVAKIRKSGLEIVFVVDSTGSMGGILTGAKQRIATMLTVLHALVPDSRIGVITYRDSGKDEDYLMRQVSLSRDHFRAAAFVQTLVAKGGGDRDEAVHEAVLMALQQRWSTGSQRVIVLVGDAPPHPATESSVISKLKAFASDGRSHVHAIVTSENGVGSVPKDTQVAFEKIAKAGRGTCIPFEDDQTVLRQVLALAFGHEYRRDLDQICKLVEERNRSIATWALDIVQRADLKAIDEHLAKDPAEPEIVKALIALPSVPIAEHLVEVMSRSSLPESARHAASWVLSNALKVTMPLLDPERGGTLTAAERKNCLELVRRRLSR